MLTITNIRNTTIIFIFNLIVITFIGFMDYITGPELSFSFFYLIPISIIALYRDTTVIKILSSSVIAALLWFFAEFYTREYSSIFYPIWNSFVRFSIFVIVGLLILYLKEKHKKLIILNSNLNALNDEKNKYLGIAAHDLRNPIGGIYSFSQILLEDYKDSLNPEILEIVNIIHQASDNSLVILKNLLDISTIESGKVVLQKKTLDYIKFIKQQIVLSQIIANHKNISIVLNPQEESLVIDFDEQYLSEVITNLLSNAMKFSYKNSEIIVKISLPSNNQILTEVIDQGQGIPDAEQDKLFNYFQKTSIRPTDGENSTGLGLAIARQIVNLHGGEIGLESSLNHGSNFYFVLPIK